MASPSTIDVTHGAEALESTFSAPLIQRIEQGEKLRIDRALSSSSAGLLLGQTSVVLFRAVTLLDLVLEELLVAGHRDFGAMKGGVHGIEWVIDIRGSH